MRAIGWREYFSFRVIRPPLGAFRDDTTYLMTLVPHSVMPLSGLLMVGVQEKIFPEMSETTLSRFRAMVRQYHAA